MPAAERRTKKSSATRMIGTADGSTKRPERFGRLPVMVRAPQRESSTDVAGHGSRGGRECLTSQRRLGLRGTRIRVCDPAHAQ